MVKFLLMAESLVSGEKPIVNIQYVNRSVSVALNALNDGFRWTMC